MAKITYSLKEFSMKKATSGKLCAVLDTSKEPEDPEHPYIVSNVIYDSTKKVWKKNSYLVGVGICTGDSRQIEITIDSSNYIFNSDGNSAYPTAKGYKIMLAETATEIMSAGSSATSATTATTNRRAGGVIETEVVDLEAPKEVIVEYLNARDHFAINALKTILERTNKDVSSLSSNEIGYYCNVAYEWAAGMMTAAANARSTYVEETPSSVDAVNLESNTEKILYDISKAVGKEASDERKITAMPNLNIATMPSVNVNQLPNVTVGVNNTVQMSGSINLGESGLGRDAQHPIYISGNGLTQAEVDARIKAWLSATTIVSDGQGGWELNVPNNI